MRKSTFSSLILFALTSIILLQSCKDDSYLLTPPPVPDQSFVEEFDTASAALARGWRFVNASDPKGGNIWQNGGAISPWFEAWSNKGTLAGFIGADYTSTSAAAGVISNWLISPSILMQNGDKIVFYTRGVLYDDFAGDSTDYANRLQVRINPNNDNVNVGSGASVGEFTGPLLDINPSYIFYYASDPDPKAFPGRWTRYEATVSGLSKATQARFGIRYFVEGGGNNGLGSGIAIDQVTYISKTN